MGRHLDRYINTFKKDLPQTGKHDCGKVVKDVKVLFEMFEELKVKLDNITEKILLKEVEEEKANKSKKESTKGSKQKKENKPSESQDNKQKE